MESGTDKNRKIVWLCHLNNPFITRKLGVKNSLEFAPWMSRLAEIFKNQGTPEIHIVSPHKSISRDKSFTDGNIHYHFFAYTIPWIPKRIFNYLHRKTHYFFNKYKIRKTIKKIHPDLIHMFGTENAYFTTGIFQMKGLFPVFISIQGFVNWLAQESNEIEYRRRKEIEIIKSFNHYGVRDDLMKNYLKELNPTVIFYEHEIAPYLPKFISNPGDRSVYDVVFFARVCQQKGIEDILFATKIIKAKGISIRVAVVGPADPPYFKHLLDLVNQLDIKEQVHFLGKKDHLDEVHEIVSQSKINVLPTYADTIPGTIIESGIIGVPTITYPVGGIPDLNSEFKSIELVETGNVLQLAERIVFLLQNESARHTLVQNMRKVIEKKWDELAIYSAITNSYKFIINEFHAKNN